MSRKSSVSRVRGRLVLDHPTLDLASNLGALVRYAVTLTTSEEACAAKLKISVHQLRRVARTCRVPLMFAAARKP